MGSATRQRFRLSGGTELSFFTAGDRSRPIMLLLHGFPNSSRMFEAVAAELSRTAYVVAPDLPGFGASDVLRQVSFSALGRATSELLDHLGVGQLYIYLHDFGAPVGLHIAMQAPERVLGLIIQNANAHRSGFGPAWAATHEFWSSPNPASEAAATTHLTPTGIRDQYVANVPADIAAAIPAKLWEEDWRVMCLPGRLEAQRSLLLDYRSHVARFGAIADYLARWQPPALMLWGRHDAFFDLAETLSWMHDLPRMEAHILDAGHMLLETHSDVAGSLIADFIGRAARS